MPRCGRNGVSLRPCGDRRACGLSRRACIPQALDQYGRTVAVCFLMATTIGDCLVRRDLAIDYEYYSRGTRTSRSFSASATRRGKSRLNRFDVIGEVKGHIRQWSPSKAGA
jgi:hypothetical protein